MASSEAITLALRDLANGDKSALNRIVPQSARKAMDIWESLKSPGLLTAYRKSIAQTRSLLNLPQ